MTSVSAGCRLVLRTSDGEVTLRALHGVDLAGQWSIPVLASTSALGTGAGLLEFSTSDGLVRLDAHLVVTEGRLGLRPGPPSPGLRSGLLQRREDVRGGVRLPLRGAALGAPSKDCVQRAPIEATVRGATLSLSAGGLAASLAAPVDAHPGSRLHVELELPGGSLIPAVVSVLALTRDQLRGRFVDIAPVDRERLVRLVFDEQRHRLAGRRRERDEG